MVWGALEAPEATEAVPAMVLHNAVSILISCRYVALLIHTTQVIKISISRYQGSSSIDGVEGLGGFGGSAALQVQFLVDIW